MIFPACSGDETTAAGPGGPAGGGGATTTTTEDGGGGATGGGGDAGGGGSGGGIEGCSAMVDTATAFLDLLEPAEYDSAAADFGSTEHRHFEFLPPLSAPRDGLTMKDLDQEERDALHGFLQAVLGAGGYMKVEAIRQLESVLAMQESGMTTTPNRDPDNYFIQIYGTPDVDSDLPWGFRFEGHHLSVQGGVIACELFSATPAFWGASPELTPLQTEVDSAIALWDALDSAQQATAQAAFSPDAINNKAGTLAAIAVTGLRAGDMTAPQVVILRQLIGAYLGNMPAPVAAQRLAAIEDAGFDDVSFVYDNGDWRVLGPTFVIELVYEGATHIHSVWRDYDGDYGDDLIAQHMAAFHSD